MASVTDIGTSALLAFQRSLSTVGHNIANATVEGYSRQRVGLGTQVPSFTGAGYFGNGVRVNDISRLYDQFTNDRIIVNTTNLSRSEHFLGLASQVDNLLADPDAGLSPALQNLFNSLQNSVDDPTSTPARQVLLSDSESLVQRFHSIDSRLRELGLNAERDLVNITTEINGLARALASVNQDIVNGTQAGGNVQPNDLLDERDQLVRELSALTKVETVQQKDGALNVFIGNGQGLVVGVTVNELGAVRNAFDPERFDIVVKQGRVNVDITQQLAGGRLGAVVDFREQVLVPGLNSLGKIAIGLSAQFNAQHALGIDLQGDPGRAYFDVPTPVVVPSTNNIGSGTLAASLVDVSNLTASDYEVLYDGANYRVTRLSDNVNLFTGSAAALNATPIDGFQINVAGAPAAGDTFQVRPTRQASRDIGVAIKDPSLIAHAAPLRGISGVSNTGNSKFSLAPVTNTSSLPLAADINLAFSLDADGGGNPGFIISGGPGGFVLYDPATESAGKQFTLAVPYDGIGFTLSGVPAAGDSLNIANNTNGVGDNRNGLLLAALQSEISLRGNNTFQSAFAELIADVGTRTRQAQLTSDAQEVLLEQSVASREAISGVNLDEEAANLVRLQQAYQAAAQVIQVSNSLFDEVIAALRR